MPRRHCRPSGSRLAEAVTLVDPAGNHKLTKARSLGRIDAADCIRPDDDKDATNACNTLILNGFSYCGGLTDGGKPVKYDPKLAAEWCTNPDYQDFANAVAWASMVVDRGAADEAEAEAVAGN